MTMGLVFWIIMLIWLLWSMPFNDYQLRAPWGGSLMLFILLALLGWHEFGPMIRG